MFGSNDSMYLLVNSINVVISTTTETVITYYAITYRTDKQDEYYTIRVNIEIRINNLFLMIFLNL